MGAIRLYGSTSGYLELQAPAVAPDAVLTLPSDSVQPGLVHLHTETFSAKSSVSINGCFSGDYLNYRITINATNTTGGALSFRLRSSGSDITASHYTYKVATLSSFSDTTAWSSVYNGRAQSSATLAFFGSSSGNAYSADIMNPASADRTSILGNYSEVGLANISLSHAGYQSSETADGLTLFMPTAFSGTLRIYGYRNS